MSSMFEVLINTTPEILSSPPPQFCHLNVTYTPFAARVGSVTYPAPIWCDFAGVWLFRWYEAIWKMAEGGSRAARLPFLYTYEIWARRTITSWWKVSMVERGDKKTRINGPESLAIPEQVEAAVLSAILRLLRGARQADAWKEDCAALDTLINDPSGYLSALDSGAAVLPHFLTSHFRIPFGPAPSCRTMDHE